MKSNQNERVRDPSKPASRRDQMWLLVAAFLLIGLIGLLQSLAQRYNLPVVWAYFALLNVLFVAWLIYRLRARLLKKKVLLIVLLWFMLRLLLYGSLAIAHIPVIVWFALAPLEFAIITSVIKRAYSREPDQPSFRASS